MNGVKLHQPRWETRRATREEVTVHLFTPRNTRKLATEAATERLTVGEQLGEPVQVGRVWTFPVVKPQVLTRAQVSLSDFPRGTRFLVLTPGSVSA